MNVRRVAFAVLLLSSAAVALAQSLPSARELYESGAALLRQAQHASAPATESDLLQRAVGKFSDAVKMQPDLCVAHRDWAVCLALLSTRATAREEQARLTAAARERFAYAADCKGVDISMFETWALFLMTHVHSVTDLPAVRASMLTEAREALEKGLQRANTDAMRARFESNLGQCLDWLAEQDPDSTNRSALLKKATTHYESAARLGIGASNAEFSGNWGLALVHLGLETHDRALLTQAVQRLQAGLAQFHDPRADAAQPMHYNLACALAALAQPDEALRQLRFCLDHDPQGEWFGNANADPDLEPVRKLKEYQQLAAARAPKPAPDSKPEQSPADRSRALFNAGLEFQRRAEVATQSARKRDAYLHAAEKYKAATDLDPVNHDAQLMWAGCLVLLETLATNRVEQLQFRQAARDRFAIAAHCPDADVNAYDDWATYLISGIYPQTTDPAAKRAVLNEAKGILESGIAVAKGSVAVAQLQSQLGVCLFTMGKAEDKTTQQRKLWEETIAQFEGAAKVEQFAKSPSLQALWGYTLVRLGALYKDRLVLQQAVSHLEIALRYDPHDLEKQYNMACAFALLKDAHGAARHLRYVLQRDPTGQYAAAAAQDPDFEPIRSTAEYRQLLHPPTTDDPIPRPHLSDK